MYQRARDKKQDKTVGNSGIRRPNITKAFRGTGRFMDGVRIRYRPEEDTAVAEGDKRHMCAGILQKPVVQGKFKGEGAPVEEILKWYARKYPGTTFSNLFLVLDAQPGDVSIVNARGESRYDPGARTLYLNYAILQQLQKAIADEENSGSAISSLLSNICHELSHVYDFVGEAGKTPRESLTPEGMSDDTFISTELRAWAREAISIMEINARYKLAYNDSNRELIEGWESLEPEMLDNLSSNRKNNCIMDRIARYLTRRLHATEPRDIQDWLNEPARKDRVKEQLQKLKTSVISKIGI